MKVAREYMAENNNIQDKELDIPCRHIGLKLACWGRACKRPLSELSQGQRTQANQTTSPPSSGAS